MYLYFNNQGVLKEIVNDDAIRQGNSNINKIRFFIEGAEPQIVNNVYKAITFITGVRTFIDVEGNQLTTESISLSTEELEIPYNKKRELKFFKYFTEYEMFSITIPDNILNESGTVGCRVQMVSAEGIITLGLIVFNVEITTGGQAIIEPDTAINIAQWNYLISNMLTPEKFVVKYDTDANQWDIVPTEGSTKPVTSGGVQQAIANALSTVYKIQGNATINELNSLEKSEAMNGYVYNMSNSGYLLNSDQVEVSVQEGDNVVFIWNSGDWYWDKLSGIIDTSNLVTTNTAQTISGQKTFTTKIFVNSISSIDYGNDLELFTVEQLKLYGGSFGIETKGTITPIEGNKDSLGDSQHTWKDGWIKNLKGTTTMTQAQYDALATKDADTFYFIEEE